jgi:orotidine-5'-phosphate decarboxylase
VTDAGFIARVWAAADARDSLVCVGLDPEPERFPAAVRSAAQPILEFNRRIIDATAEFACCFKPQFAHYAALGAEDQLLATIRYVHEHHPELPVILDSKRGDIGSTAAKYAQESFVRYEADAVTVNPYLGFDSVEPYLQWTDRGVIILCRTSNPGARDFQDLEVDGRRLYRHVAERVAQQWNGARNCLLVVGATYPAELAEVRSVVGPEVPFLVPGIGAQGGDVAAAVTAGRTPDGRGLLVNSSRAILYASSGDDFADAAGLAARTLRDQINQHRG